MIWVKMSYFDVQEDLHQALRLNQKNNNNKFWLPSKTNNKLRFFSMGADPEELESWYSSWAILYLPVGASSLARFLAEVSGWRGWSLLGAWWKKSMSTTLSSSETRSGLLEDHDMNKGHTYSECY